MQRRDFITLLGGAAAAWPLAAYAQQAVKLYRIGILSPELLPPGFLEAFRQGLREFGYVEGQNIAFEIRSAEGYGQRLAALANHLVELKVDVIVAVNTPSVQAAKKASASHCPSSRTTTSSLSLSPFVLSRRPPAPANQAPGPDAAALAVSQCRFVYSAGSCHLLTVSECVERERGLCLLLHKAANRGAGNCVPSRPR